MNNFDVILLSFNTIFILSGLIIFYRKKNELINYKQSIMPSIIGIIFIISSSTIFYFNNEQANLISFLLLKKIGDDWLPRHICSFGYGLLSWGIIIMFFVRRNRYEKTE